MTYRLRARDKKRKMKKCTVRRTKNILIGTTDFSPKRITSPKYKRETGLSLRAQSEREPRKGKEREAGKMGKTEQSRKEQPKMR